MTALGTLGSGGGQRKSEIMRTRGCHTHDRATSEKSLLSSRASPRASRERPEAWKADVRSLLTVICCCRHIPTLQRGTPVSFSSELQDRAEAHEHSRHSSLLWCFVTPWLLGWVGSCGTVGRGASNVLLVCCGKSV